MLRWMPLLPGHEVGMSGSIAVGRVTETATGRWRWKVEAFRGFTEAYVQGEEDTAADAKASLGVRLAAMLAAMHLRPL